MALTLSPSQELFVERLQRDTGLDLNVLRAWAYAEQGSEQRRVFPGRSGPNYDWLNVGITSWPPPQTMAAYDPRWWTSPVEAADLTAAWMMGKETFGGSFRASGGVERIYAAANAPGRNAATEIEAILSSGWAAGGEKTLPGLYQQFSGENLPPSQQKGASGGSSSGGGSTWFKIPIPFDGSVNVPNPIAGVESAIGGAITGAAEGLGVLLLRMLMIMVGGSLILIGLYFTVRAMGAPLPNPVAKGSAGADPLETAFAQGEASALRSAARSAGRRQKAASIRSSRPSSQANTRPARSEAEAVEAFGF